MGKEQLLQQIGLSAVAGVIGTAAAQAVRAVNRIPSEPLSHAPRAPQQGTSASGPVGGPSEGFRAAASALFSLGYASAGVAVYSAMREDPKILRQGVLLGSGLWALEYLGWIPGPRRGAPKSGGQQVMSLAQHLLYGVATVGAYHRLRQTLS